MQRTGTTFSPEGKKDAAHHSAQATRLIPANGREASASILSPSHRALKHQDAQLPAADVLHSSPPVARGAVPQMLHLKTDVQLARA